MNFPAALNNSMVSCIVGSSAIVMFPRAKVGGGGGDKMQSLALISLPSIFWKSRGSLIYCGVRHTENVHLVELYRLYLQGRTSQCIAMVHEKEISRVQSSLSLRSFKMLASSQQRNALSCDAEISLRSQDWQLTSEALTSQILHSIQPACLLHL